MKKTFLLLIVCILFTGCNLNYTLDFDEYGINETITYKFDENIYETAKNIDGDGFYVEKELAENKIPSLKNYEDYYNKKIDIDNNESVVTLKYIYSYNNLIDSYLINECYEETSFVNEEKFFSLNLTGKFSCFDGNDIIIKISSKYEVINNNASEYKNGYYIWKINDSKDNNDIKFMISKNKLVSEKNKSEMSEIRIIVVIVLFIGVITYVLIKKKISNNSF